jgi:hypothetical protein
MGNTTYRGLVTPLGAAPAGIYVGLTIGCTVPSNTLGASLQLQYANYSIATDTNASLFANIGPAVPIDNSVNHPCPGVLEGTQTLLPSVNTVQAVYEVRVVGIGGGGAGDNPRFGRVDVFIEQTLINVVVDNARSITTTGFTAWSWSVKPVSASTVRNFGWIAAQNGLSLESGTGTCTVNVGAAFCNVAITFSSAYVSAPQVSVDGTDPVSAIIIPAGVISLLLAQTLTV